MQSVRASVECASALVLASGLLASGLFASGCVDTSKPPPEGNAAGASSTGLPNVDCTTYPGAEAVLEFGDRVSTDPVPSELAGSPEPGPYRWENVAINGGGFVSGIEFSAAAPNLIYARTDVGGAYRYDVTQERWLPLTDWVTAPESNLMGIESVTPDPIDPGTVYLAAGTYITAGDGLILRSTDFGRSFSRHSIGVPMGGNANGRSMGERLAVDPNSNDTLYFGSRNDGLRVSHDAAQSWQSVASFPVLGALDLGVTLVLFDRRSGMPGERTPIIYAAVARLMADDAITLAQGGNDARNPVDALFWSRDAGESWEPVPGQPSELMPHHGALDAAGHLYLTYSDRAGPNDLRRGAVFRFDPVNGAWADVSPPRPNEQRGGFAGLGVDANHPGVVMVSTLAVWAPDEVFRTTSAGACWTRVGPSARYDERGAGWVRFGGADISATGWMGDFDIDPFDGRRALYITGQGVWWSDDVSVADAAQPTDWAFHNEGLEETVALGLVSPPAPGPSLLSAVGDIAGFRHDDLRVSPPGGMYENPVFGNTSSLDFAEQQPLLVARVGTHTSRRGAFSVNGGSSWSPFATEPAGGNGEGVVALSADGATMVWDPRGTGPHYSRDQGATWTASSGVMPPDGNTGALVADRVNPLIFYARAGGGGGGGGGGVFVSTDGGVSFAAAASNIGSGGGSRLRATLGVERDVWLSSNTGLWHSTDSAQSFVRSPAVTNATAFGFGQAPPGRAYPALYLAGSVGDQPGIYRSDDAGQTWVAIDDAAHKFGYINHLTGDPRQYGRVYLGTGGRGILVGDPFESAAPRR